MSKTVIRGVFDFVHDRVFVARTRSEYDGGYEGRIYYLCFKRYKRNHSEL